MTATIEQDRVLALERAHESGVYASRGIALVEGSGARVRDAEGREYVDCSAGHGVASVGHGHPRVKAAITAQLERLTTCPQTFANDKRSELYERLAEVVPPGLERFFLCNSGTEAVEAALKMARVTTGRNGVVATMRGFHGRTLGALSATWEKRFREPFGPLVPGFAHVPYGRLEPMEEALGADTACVIVEIVQGEGGVHAGTTEYFDGLRRLCTERGVLLVVDEVQTGFARTGAMFACEYHGLVPDLLCLGKAIGGGLPMGAVAIGPRVGALEAGWHGSTFGGNPLACAAAVAVLDVIAEEELVTRSASLGRWLLHELERIDAPIVRAVRGLGLMVGVELRSRVQPVLATLLERGVIALPAGATVLRLLPPLVIEREDLTFALETIGAVLKEQE